MANKEHPKKQAKHKRELLSSREYIKLSFQFAKEHWYYLGAVLAVYAFIFIVLTSGFQKSLDLESIRVDAEQTVGGVGTYVVTTALAGLNSTIPTDDVGATYQTVLPIIGSLALIWAIRMKHKSGTESLRIRDAFYKGMGSLVPFILVLAVIVLKLLPFIVSAYIYSSVQSGDLAITGMENFIFSGLLIIGIVWSFLWVTPSILALYAVTLPDIDPLQALRAGRELVAGRRVKTLLRFFVGVLALLVCAFLVLVITIAIAPSITVYVSLALLMLSTLLTHVYFYEVYRSLL